MVSKFEAVSSFEIYRNKHEEEIFINCANFAENDFEMLSEKEKHGISELLARMSSRDLTSLAQTVTSRLIVPETTSEAVSAILLHTEKPVDLLRRRKIKKELLFKYLNAKRMSVDPSADKSVFISQVLQLWGAHHGISGKNVNPTFF